MRPCYLELKEIEPEVYSVLWKVPARGDMRMGLYIRFSEDTEELAPPVGVIRDNAHVERWRVRRTGGLAGSDIHVDGLQSTLTDVLVRIETLEGAVHTSRLSPEQPGMTVPATMGMGGIAWTYLVLGVEHILGGIDHLLFVFALLLLTTGAKRLVKTITAFTVAHSITLSAAVLGFVRVPAAPVEPVIALSIVFLAAEIVNGHRGRAGLAARSPWVVSFAFGLLHGFGFAGALSEIGLPRTSIPLALFQFNVGVEVGQLLFVAVVLIAMAGLRRIRTTWPVWVRLGPAYAIGSIATFWCMQRIAGFWG
jgi:hydrogenase/urease accessory protein HupE